jgi:hypothetical protein
MDNILVILLSLIFIISLVLLNTRKKLISKYRSYLLIFLIIVLIVLLRFAIYDVFINKSPKSIKLKSKSTKLKEQFGGKTSKNKRVKLMEVCGMPQNYNPTSHCFNDSTHHTCCMLGPKARKYADESGNPIGTAAKKAFKQLKNRGATDEDLTPWCTCFGSEVCSYYANKFNDGTHIKLVNNPNSVDKVAYKPSHKCEGFHREKFNVKSHGTPGVGNVGKVNVDCKKEIGKIKNIFDIN